MTNLSPSLSFHLNRFNGTMESLLPFFKAVESEITDKEESLELTKNKLKRLLEQATNGIALLNSDLAITYVTPAVLKTFGYSEEELVNNPDLQIGHPDEKLILHQFLSDIKGEPGSTGEVTYRVKTKAGEWRWVKSQVTNLLHEKGINSLVFNYEDITETVLLQEQRDFEKRNTEALINSTNDLMWSVDVNMRLITGNRAFLRRIKSQQGLDLSSGDSVLDPSWVENGRAKKWEQRYLRALNDEIFTVTDFIEGPLGEQKWEEISFYPIYEKEKVKGVSCFLRDVTEKKIAFETIRKDEAVLASAEAIANFGTWECEFDANTEITSLHWSDQLYRIFGFTPGEFKITDQKFYAHVHPADLITIKLALNQTVVNKQVYDAEFRITTATGEQRWLRARAAIVSPPGVLPIKLVGTAQDTTAKKLYEEERTQLISDLLQKNKDHEQFAYVISHNLRGPVANIQGLADVFKSIVKTQGIEYKCAEGIQQAALRLDEVIKDMHSILQIKKEFSEKKTTIYLAELINDVQVSIKDYIIKQEGNIVADFTELPQIFTIRGYLYSIIYNLITNSLKYRQAGVAPVIHIHSRVQHEKAELIFRDNGIGIDMPRFKNKLFTLYQRFHENIEGKGVGLYMVKTHVEALGGTIEVKSELNAGTEFIISLPL